MKQFFINLWSKIKQISKLCWQKTKNTSLWVWKKIKQPKPWIAVLFTIFTLLVVAGTILLIAFEIMNFLTYTMFGISAIVLAYEVYIVVFYTPKIKNYFLTQALKNKFLNQYIKNFGYRSLVASSFGFAFNIAYATLQAVLAILSKSIWYGALATYYIALTLIRGGILIKYNKRKEIDTPEEFLLDQVKSFKNCGWYLTALTLGLTGALVQMAIGHQGFKYAGLMIYVMAAYTFYKLTMSIINIIKAKKNNDYTVQSIRNLNFVSTLVSILALQTALLDAFGNGLDPTLANSLTGAGVAIAIITIGVLMIVFGNKKIKSLTEEQINEKLDI